MSNDDWEIDLSLMDSAPTQYILSYGPDVLGDGSQNRLRHCGYVQRSTGAIHFVERVDEKTRNEITAKVTERLGREPRWVAEMPPADDEGEDDDT